MTVPAAPEKRAEILSRIRESGFVRRALDLRERHKRFEPAAFFFGGVVWDASTLRRIDAVIDNVLLGAYLIVLGVLIVAAVTAQADRPIHRLAARYRDALPAAVQFFMGALFSAYVVFYFQSASLTSTSIFLGLLLLLLVANEFVHRRMFNVYLLVALYFLASFSFFVFFVPVVTKTMNYVSFLAGGLLSAAVAAGMLSLLWRQGIFEKARELALAAGVVGLLFVTLNVFYLNDWIPPVPLSLRHAGIYHDVKRTGEEYELTFERPDWYEFWVDDDRHFIFQEGDAVYCFAAVFAPTELRKAVYHEWSRYDEHRREWLATDRMEYEIEGYREAGYRWYSRKRNVQPGQWRVDIRTAEGRTLGRVRFRLDRSPARRRELRTIVYD